MYVRRGIVRLLLLATFAWVAFVAYDAWGTIPRGEMPVVATQLANYCRFNFRVTSEMSASIVRYEAMAQYHQARTSLRGAACRAYQQLSENEVADLAARSFMQWQNDQRFDYQRRLNARVDAWTWNYLLHAIAPPLFVWLLLPVILWIAAGVTRRSEA